MFLRVSCIVSHLRHPEFRHTVSGNVVRKTCVLESSFRPSPSSVSRTRLFRSHSKMWPIDTNHNSLLPLPHLHSKRAQIENYDKTEPHFGFNLGLKDISGPNAGSLSIIHRSERIAMVMAGSAGSGKSSNDLCAALTAACLRRCARAYYRLKCREDV